VGIGDDAAIFAPAKGCETILTCDWFLEGTHFLLDKHPADAVGWKCLARAVSDVAAMGGRPRCFLLSLALSASHTGRWLGGFLEGLKRAARRFGCVAAGGDTTECDRILVNVTVVGEVRVGRAVLRAGAKPGDLLFLSGRLGEAEMGLRLLRRGGKKSTPRNAFVKKHLYPEPRLALGHWLAEKDVASAMMDISDGLSSDLSRLCVASGVGARIEEKKLPKAEIPIGGRSREEEALRMALDGGDDYELLFAAPKRMVGRLRGSVGAVKITQIGVVIPGSGVALVRKDGREEGLRPRGWDPFRR